MVTRNGRRSRICAWPPLPRPEKSPTVGNFALPWPAVRSGRVAADLRTEDPSLYHKNLRPVTYVTGDLAGAAESPVDAILRMNEAISRVVLPEGYAA